MIPEIKRIQALEGGGGAASLELVEVGGSRFVLKRSAPARAEGERRFQLALKSAGLPSLAMLAHPALSPSELLLEYVEGSPTIGRSAATPELCGRWGAAVAAMHSIRSDAFERVDSAGAVVSGSWRDFVDRLIARGLGAQRSSDTDLSTALLARAETLLGALRDFTPQHLVLTHGDLHANNALLRGPDVVLFDKASRVWSCPPAFDLSLVYCIGFADARYGVTRPREGALRDAFAAAYGDLIDDDARWLDHFGLAHCLMRYPNPYTPDLRQIIEAIVDRLSNSGSMP